MTYDGPLISIKPPLHDCITTLLEATGAGRKKDRKKEDLGVDVAENKRVRERKCMEEKDNLLRVLAEKESFTAVQTLCK